MFCSKCGKEISDEAVICPGCGCPVKPMASSVEKQQTNGSTVIKTSMGKLFGTSMIGGLCFGLFMGLMMIEYFFLIFILCGISFGLLFFGMIAAFSSSLEKKTVTKFREEVSQKGEIYFEGAANLKGNGGWLFVTQNGIEHRVHNMNFNTQPTILSHSDVVSIKKQGNKLAVKTAQNEYAFVVNDVDRWMMYFKKCDYTKNKV